MLLDFYMPFSSIAQTPQFFIIQHQPIISILTLIYTTTLLSHWHNEVHQQLAQQSKNYNQQENCIPERTCHLFPSYCLLCLPPTAHFANLFQCSRSLHHPSLGITLVPHNTKTNKVAYPCIPYSNNRIVFVANAQKVDGH